GLSANGFGKVAPLHVMNKFDDIHCNAISSNRIKKPIRPVWALLKDEHRTSNAQHRIRYSVNLKERLGKAQRPFEILWFA
ncbi:MAG: hypothetical protein QNL14_00830, partial [Deltaproteobacteria bacterium]|nr:hypothetical protein [Deltaproteobacteria bacterium]